MAKTTGKSSLKGYKIEGLFRVIPGCSIQNPQLHGVYKRFRPIEREEREVSEPVMVNRITLKTKKSKPISGIEYITSVRKHIEYMNRIAAPEWAEKAS